MNKRGKTPKKKLQVPSAPVAEQKRTGDPHSLLPSARNSPECICWRFRYLDREGPWGLAHLPQEQVHALIADMTKFESQTIDELFHRGEWPGKCHDVAALPNHKALERLDILGIPDMTKIWKLRVSGPGRLWGFLVDHVFHVVWWDPNHEVWPSKIKHT